MNFSIFFRVLVRGFSSTRRDWNSPLSPCSKGWIRRGRGARAQCRRRRGGYPHWQCPCPFRPRSDEGQRSWDWNSIRRSECPEERLTLDCTHTHLDGVVEEDGVHGLSHGLIPTKWKGNVRNPATDPTAGTLGLRSTHSKDLHYHQWCQLSNSAAFQSRNSTFWI